LHEHEHKEDGYVDCQALEVQNGLQIPVPPDGAPDGAPDLGTQQQIDPIEMDPVTQEQGYNLQEVMCMFKQATSVRF
jgi:hypothetical protein